MSELMDREAVHRRHSSHVPSAMVHAAGDGEGDV